MNARVSGSLSRGGMPASPSLSPNFEATNWGDGPSRVSNSFDRRLPSQHHYRQPSGHKVARAPIVAAPPRNAAHGHYDRQHYQPDTSRVPDANEWTPPISAIPRPSAAAGVEMTGVGGRGNVPRYTSTPPPPPPLPANVPGTYAMDMNGQSNLAREQQQQQQQPPPPPQSPQQQHGASHRPRRMVGSYQLAKTIGAGSMGKVKLALDIRSNERVAAKVIPRNQPDIPVSFPSDLDMHPVRRPKITVPDGFGGERQIPPGHPEYNDALTKHYLEVFSAQADIHPHPAPLLPRDRWTTKERERRENKDVRVLREIAINRLLFHPNVCVLLDVIVHPNHYYIFQELVSGGQMLDYIISHGRLKEKHARKFARQIASAIDYCHKNSIVHRDLKIENILISSNGNIKIIDFGLSNLYSPRSALSTFCGSLYFAAPELLNAQPYMGPEVDIWSFGVVLYVLVCGKVPFDDQLMPALHAKIKRGHVEYPSSLTAECKHLLSRLLVVQPQKRATMGEVVRHPWMCRGYDSPIDALVPYREPLVMPEQLDENVIREIEQYVGFGFGSALEIRRSLIATMTSDWYRGWIREKYAPVLARLHESRRSRDETEDHLAPSPIRFETSLLSGEAHGQTEVPWSLDSAVADASDKKRNRLSATKAMHRMSATIIGDALRRHTTFWKRNSVLASPQSPEAQSPLGIKSPEGSNKFRLASSGTTAGNAGFSPLSGSAALATPVDGSRGFRVLGRGSRSAQAAMPPGTYRDPSTGMIMLVSNGSKLAPPETDYVAIQKEYHDILATDPLLSIYYLVKERRERERHHLQAQVAEAPTLSSPTVSLGTIAGVAPVPSDSKRDASVGQQPVCVAKTDTPLSPPPTAARANNDQSVASMTATNVQRPAPIEVPTDKAVMETIFEESGMTSTAESKEAGATLQISPKTAAYMSLVAREEQRVVRSPHPGQGQGSPNSVLPSHIDSQGGNAQQDSPSFESTPRSDQPKEGSIDCNDKPKPSSRKRHSLLKRFSALAIGKLHLGRRSNPSIIKDKPTTNEANGVIKTGEKVPPSFDRPQTEQQSQLPAQLTAHEVVADKSQAVAQEGGTLNFLMMPRSSMPGGNSRGQDVAHAKDSGATVTSGPEGGAAPAAEAPKETSTDIVVAEDVLVKGAKLSLEAMGAINDGTQPILATPTRRASVVDSQIVVLTKSPLAQQHTPRDGAMTSQPDTLRAPQQNADVADLTQLQQGQQELAAANTSSGIESPPSKSALPTTTNMDNAQDESVASVPAESFVDNATNGELDQQNLQSQQQQQSPLRSQQYGASHSPLISHLRVSSLSLRDTSKDWVSRKASSIKGRNGADDRGHQSVIDDDAVSSLFSNMDIDELDIATNPSTMADACSNSGGDVSHQEGLGLLAGHKLRQRHGSAASQQPQASIRVAPLLMPSRSSRDEKLSGAPHRTRPQRVASRYREIMSRYSESATLRPPISDLGGDSLGLRTRLQGSNPNRGSSDGALSAAAKAKQRLRHSLNLTNGPFRSISTAGAAFSKRFSIPADVSLGGWREGQRSHNKAVMIAESIRQADGGGVASKAEGAASIPSPIHEENTGAAAVKQADSAQGQTVPQSVGGVSSPPAPGDIGSQSDLHREPERQAGRTQTKTSRLSFHLRIFEHRNQRTAHSTTGDSRDSSSSKGSENPTAAEARSSSKVASVANSQEGSDGTTIRTPSRYSRSADRPISRRQSVLRKLSFIGRARSSRSDHQKGDMPTTVQADSRPSRVDESIRLVSLKGLFSVSTTSTKTPAQIRERILAVLNAMEIYYREGKGQIECVITAPGDTGSANLQDFDKSPGDLLSPKEKPNHPQPAVVQDPANADTQQVPIHADASQPLVEGQNGVPERSRSLANRYHQTKSHPATDKPDSLRAVSIRFRIRIVRVPLPGMYGIQFRQISGSTWKYKDTCSHILNKLKI